MLLLKLLNNKNFRYYFLADLFTGFGHGLIFTGINWYILEKTGSNTLLGSSLSVLIFVSFLCFPIGGIFADRFNRKNILIIINSLNLVFFAGLICIFFSDAFNTIYLFIMRVAAGASYAFFRPSSDAFMQELLKKKDMVKGTSLIEISMQAGMFLSAPAAGYLYKLFDFGSLLIFCIVTYFLGILSMYRIQYEKARIEDTGQTPYRQMINGLRYLGHNLPIFGLGIFLFIPWLATVNMNVILPGYVKDFLKADSVVFGLADMFYAVGAFFSGFAASYIVSIISRTTTIVGFHLLSLSALIASVFNVHIPGIYITMFFFGFANSSIRILLKAKLMEIVPNNVMGRVMAVWNSIAMLLIVIVSFGTGYLLDRIAPNKGFYINAAIMLIALMGCSWFISKTKNIRADVEEKYAPPCEEMI